jgi:integrase
MPYVGDYFVDAITPLDVTRWRDAQQGAPSTVNGRLRVLRTLLADATQDLGLPRDPAGRVRALREKRPEEDPNVLTAKELGEVLLVMRETEPDWYPLFLTIGLTGMRFGEATALKWSDVDEKARLVHVRRSQWKGTVDETKTGSRRTVPLPEVLAHALRKHRHELLARQAPGLEQGWVFPNRVGRLLYTASLQKPLKRALGRAGITRRQTTHGFRRTFNNLVRQFTTGEVVRAMTGHVTEAMTLHYSHVELGEKHAAVDRVLATVAGQVEGWVEGLPDGTETAG